MYIDKHNINQIIKKINLSNKPFCIFENEIINFFETISNTILSKKKFSKFPDLVAFGFWCRKKNLISISENYQQKQIGRGLVFHISPSNVPMNFAFSLAFGLLSGNSNLVRLPSIEFPQVKLISNLINKIINKKGYKSAIYNTDLDNNEREENLNNFKSGNLNVLVSCTALDEGFDMPEADGAMILSASSSKRQRIQRMGRVLRITANKENALIVTVYSSNTEYVKLKEESNRYQLENVPIRWQKMK